MENGTFALEKAKPGTPAFLIEVEDKRAIKVRANFITHTRYSICTRLNVFVVAGVWKEHFHWLSHSFLCWSFPFTLHASVQPVNK